MTQKQHRELCSFLVRCEQAYNLVHDFLNDTLPHGMISARARGYTYRPQRRSIVKEKVKKSLEVLEACIERHNIEEIAISYNGGKDCLVMLILLLATIHKRFSSETFTNPSLNLLPKDYRLDSIYINSEEPFPEVSKFIIDSTEYYSLNPITIKSTLKEGFQTYLDENPKIKTIVVGIRYADPYGSMLQYEQTTDDGWPKFLRIHPILHWHYVDIWDFIIGCDLDYCSLYDKGYTSIGGVDTTTPNEFLKIGNKFLPAYMLEEYADERERLGRNSKQRK
ncbi:hypothetical protein CJJ07_001033 [Candidozyma auris]|nr:hypothetical protein CJJ07_001033 [[Candida] auris]QEL59115.1 hypothetical protein CJJ09_001184 [[Candida] auris]